MIRRALVPLWLVGLLALLGCDSSPSTRPAPPLELDSLLVEVSFPPGEETAWWLAYAQEWRTQSRLEMFSFVSTELSRAGRLGLPYDPSARAFLTLSRLSSSQDTVGTWTVTLLRQRQDGSRDPVDPLFFDSRRVIYSLNAEGKPHFPVHEVSVTLASLEAVAGNCPGIEEVRVQIRAIDGFQALGDFGGMMRWTTSQLVSGDTPRIRMTAPSLRAVSVLYSDETRPSGIQLYIDGAPREMTCQPGVEACPGVRAYSCIYVEPNP